MRIQTRIRLSVAATFVISAAVVVIVYSVIAIRSAEAERRRVFDEITEKTYALNVLTARFWSPPDPGQLRQIRAMQKSLERLLGTITSPSPAEEKLAQQIRANFRDLGFSLERLIENWPGREGSRGLERHELLVSQLGMKTQFITEDIRRLMEISSDRIDSAQRQALILTIILIVTLLLVNAAISLVTGRHIVRAQEDIHRALEEKEVLLRELAHRTKNNLQVIDSLLRLQSASSADDAYTSTLSDVRSRIGAMALVHEKLYRTGNFSSLNMKEYVGELVPSLLRTHQGTDGGVSPVLELEEMSISIDAALPCGLIISELVSNSMKHAFPGRSSGTVFLSLRRDGDTVQLRYRDDGRGLPRDIDPSRIRSLGLKLVYNLAVRQLRGTMEIVHRPEQEFVFAFPDPERTDRS